MSLTRKTSMRDAYAAKLRAKGQFSTFKRKPVKLSSSSRQIRRNQDHAKLRKQFMFDHPTCQICPMRGQFPATSTELHHWAGRIGKLLNYIPYFRSSCTPCHAFIHAHPSDARAIGALAPANEWNVYPK